MAERHSPASNHSGLEYGYEQAIEISSQQLAKIDDIDQQCLRSGARYQVIDSQKVIILEYLNGSYKIVLPDVNISLTDSEQEVPLKDRVLILHYLTSAKGTPAANKMIAFRELPQGANYFPVFFNRAIKPLLDHFGQEPGQLIDAAKKLGGHKVDYGDVAVTINAFSRVPITLVLWRGDAEFAPQGSILFDASISDYLSSYDITELCQTITWKLIRGSKQH